jgi:NAD+ diphosphatase
MPVRTAENSTVERVAVFVPSLAPPADHVGPALWFHVRGAELHIAGAPVVEDGTPVFLGMLDDHECWAVDADGVEPDGFVALRGLYGVVPDEHWTIAGRAVQLVEWERTHRYCGRCATPTEASPNERAKRCPECGLQAFPRLAPAIITLVERDDEVLLARGVQFPLPMYSCLAGFVEPGETLEQAVAREVREEVGVEITDITYVGSQPWPFPHSLMIGFNARWQRGDIVCDPAEIVDAGWFRADSLPMIPPGISIARQLIDRWLVRPSSSPR